MNDGLKFKCVFRRLQTLYDLQTDSKTYQLSMTELTTSAAKKTLEGLRKRSNLEVKLDELHIETNWGQRAEGGSTVQRSKA